MALPLLLDKGCGVVFVEEFYVEIEQDVDPTWQASSTALGNGTHRSSHTESRS
jgi:hypothetical protein